MNGVTITIHLSPEGQLKVEGPLENKILMMGMLGMAYATLIVGMSQEDRRVQPAAFFPGMKPGTAQ